MAASLDNPVTASVAIGGTLILASAVLAMLIRTARTAKPPV